LTSIPAVLTAPEPLEDALAYLPCTSVLGLPEGQIIYEADQSSTSLYLVIDGKVNVSRLTDDGSYVGVDIYRPDEVFGESALLNLPHRAEQATALENTNLICQLAPKNVLL